MLQLTSLHALRRWHHASDSQRSRCGAARQGLQRDWPTAHASLSPKSCLAFRTEPALQCQRLWRQAGFDRGSWSSWPGDGPWKHIITTGAAQTILCSPRAKQRADTYAPACRSTCLLQRWTQGGRMLLMWPGAPLDLRIRQHNATIRNAHMANQAAVLYQLHNLLWALVPASRSSYG